MGLSLRIKMTFIFHNGNYQVGIYPIFGTMDVNLLGMRPFIYHLALHIIRIPNLIAGYGKQNKHKDEEKTSHIITFSFAHSVSQLSILFKAASTCSYRCFRLPLLSKITSAYSFFSS